MTSPACAGSPGATRRPRVALVLLAAGSGTRTGLSTSKVLQPLGGRSVLAWSLDHAARPDVTRTVVVIRDQDEEHVRALLAAESPGCRAEIVAGGRSRHESELHALRTLAGDIGAGLLDIVVVHDAARPLAAPRLYQGVIGAAHAYGGAIPVVRRTDLAWAATGRPVGPAVTVQTPQAFRAGPLLRAYEQAGRAGFEGTDTAACAERFTSLTIRAVPGDARNIKITFPEDLALAGKVLRRLGGRP